MIGTEQMHVDSSVGAAEQGIAEDWEALAATGATEVKVADTNTPSFEPSPNCPQPFLCSGNEKCANKCASNVLAYAGVELVGYGK
jgi:hypothetical protein